MARMITSERLSNLLQLRAGIALDAPVSAPRLDPGERNIAVAVPVPGEGARKLESRD